MVVLQPIKPGPPRVSISLKRGRGARRALSLLGNNDSRQNLQLAESLLTISAEEFAQKWNFDPIEGVPLSAGRFHWKPVSPPVASPDPPTAAATSSSQSEVATSKATWAVDLGSASDPPPHPADDNSKVQMTCTTLPSSSSSALGQEVIQGQSTGATSGSVNPPIKSAEVGTVNSVTEGHLSSSKTSARPEDTEKGQLMDGSPCEALKTEGDSGIESDVADEQDSSSLLNNDSSQINSLRQTHITEFVRPRKLASFKIAEPLPLTNNSSSNNTSCSKKRSASSLQDHQLNQPPHKKVLLHLRA